jgi:hypothetical protein
MMNDHHSAYLQAAIDGEVARLASAQPGERNTTLFRASVALASLHLREGEILRHFKPVAERIGLRGSEFYSTVKNGVRAGHANPRVIPPKSIKNGCRTKARSATPEESVSVRPNPHARRRQPMFVVGDESGPSV